MKKGKGESKTLRTLHIDMKKSESPRASSKIEAYIEAKYGGFQRIYPVSQAVSRYYVINRIVVFY